MKIFQHIIVCGLALLFSGCDSSPPQKSASNQYGSGRRNGQNLDSPHYSSPEQTAAQVISHPVIDPLAHFYQPYQGAQQNWPTAPGCFVTQQGEITIYHGLRATTYTIIGRFDRSNLPPDKLAASARFHGANAVCLSEEEIRGITTEPGVALFNERIAVQTPTTTMPNSKVVAHAYLIKISDTTQKSP